MTFGSLTRKGAAIGIGVLALTLVACWGEVAKVAEEAVLTVTEDSRLTVGLELKGALKAESSLDTGAVDRDLLDAASASRKGPITPPKATGTIDIPIVTDSIVIAKVKEQAGELFSEAICQGMLEIALWRNPSATVDPARWARFLVDYVEKRARELVIPTVHEIVANRATALAASLELGTVNVGRAIPYAKGCLAGIQVVANSTPPPARAAVAVGDSCLVGRWIGRSKAITRNIDNMPTFMFGGSGAVLTIDADGTAVLNYRPSTPFVGRVNGQTVAFLHQGTETSRIHGYPPHRLVEAIQSEAVTSHWFINGQWQQPTVVLSTPSTTYSCTTTTLIEGDARGSDSYVRG